jgi:hypothetical protein
LRWDKETKKVELLLGRSLIKNSNQIGLIQKNNSSETT